MLLDPQRKLKKDDISLPLKHSFIHTGHMNANTSQKWGYPDKIDEIFLKNPLNPPDMRTTVSVSDTNQATITSSSSTSGELEDNECLIDLNVNYMNENEHQSREQEQELNEILYNNQDYVSFKPLSPNILNLYENNDYLTLKEQQQKKRESPSLIHPLEIFQRSSPNSTRSSKNFKNSDFKTSTLQNTNENKSKKVDFDEFLNKVMNDVINDLNSYSKLNSKNEKKQEQNNYFYSHQTLVQTPLRLSHPPSSSQTQTTTETPIYTNSMASRSSALIYQNTNNNQHQPFYENFFDRAYF